MAVGSFIAAAAAGGDGLAAGGWHASERIDGDATSSEKQSPATPIERRVRLNRHAVGRSFCAAWRRRRCDLVCRCCWCWRWWRWQRRCRRSRPLERGPSTSYARRFKRVNVCLTAVGRLAGAFYTRVDSDVVSSTIVVVAILLGECVVMSSQRNYACQYCCCLWNFTSLSVYRPTLRAKYLGSLQISIYYSTSLPLYVK